MGLLPLNYRRPALVRDNGQSSSTSSASSNNSGARTGSADSMTSGTSAGIPNALSFNRIMDGGTCPPCTVRDFMNYLIYVERSAENLQFFLWYRDYVRRFAEADTSDIALAQEWTQAMEDEAVAKIQKDHVEKLRRQPPAAAIFKGTDFEKGEQSAAHAEGGDPFGTPPRSLGGDQDSYLSGSRMTGTYREQASEAFTQAGIKQPFFPNHQVTIQPFRGEIDRVIATYIMDDAPRQLNLSSRDQKAVLAALAYTTHPSALRTTAGGIEATLRHQAHPNFIRWSVCNGNPARVCFARALGASTVALATAAALVLTLSRAGRGYRAVAAVGWALGMATLVAAGKGMCVVLHGLHHRHVRPWELFESDDEDGVGGGGGSAAEKGKMQGASSFDSFGSGNSYEEEPWVIRYRERNVVRKIFDREVWIREPALRQIQDTIFVQAVLGGLLFAGVMCAIFVPVPGGGFF